MNVKRNYLKKRIEFFLSQLSSEIPVPSSEITDDERIPTMLIRFSLSKDLTLNEAKIYANIDFFKDETFDAELCHEIGHIIAFRKKINLPIEGFFSSLKNELSADREGFRLFVLSGKKGIHFLKPFDSFFKTFVKKIFLSQKRIPLLKRLAQSLIRVSMLLLFVLKHAIFKYKNSAAVFPL